jgi:hypothetical protein
MQLIMSITPYTVILIEKVEVNNCYKITNVSSRKYKNEINLTTTMPVEENRVSWSVTLIFLFGRHNLDEH